MRLKYVAFLLITTRPRGSSGKCGVKAKSRKTSKCIRGFALPQPARSDQNTPVPLTCPPRTGPGVMLVLGLKEREVKMARRKHTAEQIINKLREAEVAISAGSTVAEVSRQIGVTQQTFYRWRTEYGGLKIDQARRLKQLETENGRLRRAVADLTLDNQILREAAEETSKPFSSSPVCGARQGDVRGLRATSLQGAGPSQVDASV